MATILTKKSDTASAVPVAGDLTNSSGGAELAVNTADKRLFAKNSGGTVVEIGTNPTVIQVDNININGNAITSTDTNGNIDLTPNGTGEVNITKVDIDSGTIDGTAIGASSASTGAFTTLSASSTVTLSGGTANGVAYLNGSKVLTSGSALTFDGNSLSITTASGNAVSTLTGASTLGAFTNYKNATADHYIGANNNAASLFGGVGGANSLALATYGNLPIGFGINASEQMRLTSTGLGIGTSSPAAKLDVQSSGSLMLNLNSTANTPYMQFNHSGAAKFYIGESSQIGGGAGFYDIYAVNGLGLRLYTNGVRAATIDSSGNLGLGVTPSAWQSATIRPIEINRIGNFVGGNGSAAAVYLGANTRFESANWLYANNGAAGLYTVEDNTHFWRTAPSGTAGNAITFTQAMTLDASGNLGVGTTSPTDKLHVDGGASSTYIKVVGQSATAYFGQDTVGLTVYQKANKPIYFVTNDTERMRIDSSGNLLVGTTSAAGGERLNVTGSTSGISWLSRFINPVTTAADNYGLYINYSGAAPNGTGNEFLFCSDTGATRATIRSNGGLANYSANDVNLSDRREKTNFAPAKNYLDTICAIPVQTFNYIDQNLEEDGGLTLGVVAQDVQEVAPELVMESNWGTEENPKMRLSIYQTDLQYALMKCIQELKAENDALKSRLDAAGL